MGMIFIVTSVSGKMLGFYKGCVGSQKTVLRQKYKVLKWIRSSFQQKCIKYSCFLK
jgi:hypothetical protein